ncbi:uncharacterized protein LOC143281088 [Babylonia areolata]|uniref:uncharacterized protein LOC143281088 n=1 Tax=Babylonia areolata TaxID=304850 RepID=UPI003FD5E3BE
MESEDERLFTEEAFHSHSVASRSSLPSIEPEQEFGKVSCHLLEARKGDAGRDTMSLVSGRDPISSTQEVIDAAYSDQGEEQKSLCSAKPDDQNPNNHMGAFSESARVSDVGSGEKESGDVSNVPVHGSDTCCESGDRIRNQQEQTPSMLGPTGLVQPAVPHNDDHSATVAVLTENGSHDIANSNKQTDHAAVNPVPSHNVQVHSVFVSLNGSSPGDGIPLLTVSESSDSITSCADVNSVQITPVLSTGDAAEDQMPVTCQSSDNITSCADVDSVQITPVLSTGDEAEDQMPATAVAEYDTGQGHTVQSHLSSEKCATDHFIENSMETLPDTSAAMDGEIIQSCHSSKLSVVPTGNAHNESSPVTADSELSSVRVKDEPLDTGYQQALMQNEQRTSLNKKSIKHSQTAKVTDSSRSDVITTVNKEGKKRRVRIVVVKGEWRKPKAKAKQQNLTSAVRQDMRQITLSHTQRPASTFRSDSSAFPTALFRNVHIKTEPVDSDYPDIDPLDIMDSQQPAISSSSRTSSQQRTIPEPGTASQQTLCQTPTFTETGTRSSATSSSSTSHFSQRMGQRERGREQMFLANASSASTASVKTDKTLPEKSAESRIQPCGVRLRKLPPQILVSGMVNLKTDPQLLQDAAVSTVTSSLVGRRPHDGSRPWECEVCGKTYKTKSARTQHYKVHSGLREHVCSVCGADFAYKSVLTSHYRFVHLKEKPHECPVCGKRFGWSSHLATHLSRHYEDKPYTCPICHRQFNRFYIKKHLDTHSDKRAFHCTVCKARYKSKKALQEHEKVHSGHRPFRCHICGLQFPYSSSLVAHMRTHTGERPFACHKCPSTFTQSTHLRTHLRGVHKIKNFPSRRGRELVERVFPMPPSSISQDPVELMRHTLNQVERLGKKVLVKNQDKPLTAAEDSHSVQCYSTSRTKHVQIKKESKRPNTSRKGFKRHGRDRFLAQKHAGTEKSGAVPFDDDAPYSDSTYSSSVRSQKKTAGRKAKRGRFGSSKLERHHENELYNEGAEEKEQNSSKRARLEADEESDYDVVGDNECDEDILEANATPATRSVQSGCVLKFNFRGGKGDRGLAGK